MKEAVQTILSVLLLTFIPSIGIFTILSIYLNVDPFLTNIVTGGVMFVFGGVMIATNMNKSNDANTEKEKINGGNA